MRIALDTNVLAYAEGVNGVVRKNAAVRLVTRLPPDATVIPVQALGELFNVLVRKARRSRAKAQAAVLGWRDAFPVADTTAAVMEAAADLAVRHRLGIWDAVIFAAAADAGCRLLLSEDLQEGFTWSGVTVTNPFARPWHALLDTLLQNAAR